jgi:hypothetical protein
MACGNIPYQQEQGIIFKEQGNSAQEHGTLSPKIQISVGRDFQHSLRVVGL